MIYVQLYLIYLLLKDDLSFSIYNSLTIVNRSMEQRALFVGARDISSNAES